MGFSDKRLATLAVRSVGVAGGLGETQARRSGLLHDALRAMAGATSEEEVRELRQQLGVLPVFKRIDSCAAEFEAITPYMYSTYEAPTLRRARGRGLAERPQEDRHPRRRAEPDRAGHRVRLLLRPRLLRAERGRVRDDHGQLQPGNRVDRLRHLRPALFRAADRRRRARNPARRAAERRTGRRDRAVRRADPAQAGRGAGGGGDSDPRHLARRDRPCRRPRAVRQAGRQARAQAARRTASPTAATRLPRSPRASAIRCCCARATCLAGGRWRSSIPKPSSTITSPPRSTCRAKARCWSTSICATRSNATSMRCATASRWSSPA